MSFISPTVIDGKTPQMVKTKCKSVTALKLFLNPMGRDIVLMLLTNSKELA